MRRVLKDTLTSSDGTTIAFERLGDGPAVIVVGGQLADRALTRPTAEELAQRFTVINYDRRGRGDSAPHKRKPNTSRPYWQKVAAARRSSTSGGPSGCRRRWWRG